MTFVDQVMSSSSGFDHLGPQHILGSKSARHPGPQPSGSSSSSISAALNPLNAPFLDPRGRDRSSEEQRAQRFKRGGDEASLTLGVPHHTPPDLAISVPLLSCTPTPVGSLVKGGD
ncbi:hypothetical protein M9458_050478 [Cirrhinus mrigala]|uniref:Uncharacterized protein n=1 Tax=Cirrhinus mrigala TaxID=683832 RepID=A0ABD0MYM7_CIRMR